MAGLFQRLARHVELLKLLMMYWEQSQFSKGKASLDGQSGSLQNPMQVAHRCLHLETLR